MNLKRLTAAASLALAVAAPVVAQTTDTSRDANSTRQSTSDNRDWGWLGLLGLVGLAGLFRRRPEDHRYDTTTRTTTR